MSDALQVVREGSKRVLNMRPFDVQLIGGMILHEGEIAEMRTGEGKTLVSVSCCSCELPPAQVPHACPACEGSWQALQQTQCWLFRRCSQHT